MFSMFEQSQRLENNNRFRGKKGRDLNLKLTQFRAWFKIVERRRTVKKRSDQGKFFSPNFDRPSSRLHLLVG